MLSFFFIFCLNFCFLIAPLYYLFFPVSHLCSCFLKDPVSQFYLSTLIFSFTILHLLAHINTQVNREQVQFLKTKEDFVWNYILKEPHTCGFLVTEVALSIIHCWSNISKSIHRWIKNTCIHFDAWYNNEKQSWGKETPFLMKHYLLYNERQYFQSFTVSVPLLIKASWFVILTYIYIN